MHYKFLIETMALMPHLRIVSTDAKPLGGGVFRVRAVVANDGYLPTMSEMGRLSRHAYPLQVALEVPEKVMFIQGSPRRQIGRLTGNGGSSEADVAGAGHRWFVGDGCHQGLGPCRRVGQGHSRVEEEP